MRKSCVTSGMSAELLWCWAWWGDTCLRSCIWELSCQRKGSLYFCNSSGDSFGLTQSRECLSNHVHTQNRWLAWEARTTVQHVRVCAFFSPFLGSFLSWNKGNNVLILFPHLSLFSFSCQIQGKMHFSDSEGRVGIFELKIHCYWA